MELNFDEIREYIKNCSESTKFYIGVDSQRVRKKKKGQKVARYMISVIAHIDGKHGGRVFGGVSYHPIVDSNLGRPFNRLFKEAEMVVSTYEELFDVLHDKKVELHIDVSPNKEAGSNIVHNAAKGFIIGMTGIEPKVKPEAWAASCVADHFVKA
jgi:predicted RNase H-related nuclease YkuK (DUF458 family)